MTSALGKWLQHVKRVRLPACFTRPQRPFTLVTGNESCDLDSASSAIATAYFSSILTQHIKTYIPILAIPRSDLSLRPELLYLFQQTGIDPADVCTLDDVSTLDPTKTQLMLVDHNVPRGKIEELFQFETHTERKGQVEGIIDHHEQEAFFSTEQRSRMEVHDIEVCGSCCSLVTRWIMKSPGLDKLRETVGETHGIATLLLAPILIDTANLTSKVHDVDAIAAHFLAEFVPELQFADFYSHVRDVKMSIEGMQLQDILRRDYKQYETCSGQLGMSTVTRTISFLRDQSPEFEAVYTQFAAERSLAVHITMTVDGQGKEFRRGGMVFTRDEDFLREFERRGGEKYAIGGEFVTGFAGEGGMKWWVYEQGELSASRKQIAPLAQGIMDRKKA